MLVFSNYPFNCGIIFIGVIRLTVFSPRKRPWYFVGWQFAWEIVGFLSTYLCPWLKVVRTISPELTGNVTFVRKLTVFCDAFFKKFYVRKEKHAAETTMSLKMVQLKKPKKEISGRFQRNRLKQPINRRATHLHDKCITTSVKAVKFNLATPAKILSYFETDPYKSITTQ